MIQGFVEINLTGEPGEVDLTNVTGARARPHRDRSRARAFDSDARARGVTPPVGRARRLVVVL